MITDGIVNHFQRIHRAHNSGVRWNILHILCMRGNTDSIEYILSKLPKETIQILLAQQSKNRLNTVGYLLSTKAGPALWPITCNSHSISQWNVIWKMPFVPSSHSISNSDMLLRDSEGFTPLHAAVQRGFPQSTRLLLKLGPSTALHLENGVGGIPLLPSERLSGLFGLNTRDWRRWIVSLSCHCKNTDPVARTLLRPVAIWKHCKSRSRNWGWQWRNYFKKGDCHLGPSWRLSCWPSRIGWREDRGRLAAMRASLITPPDDGVKENKPETRIVPQVETYDR